MNQGDLIEKVAKRASISKAEAERAINAVKEAIADSLRKNDKVPLVGFGTFAVSHRKARRGHNPYTAERIKIPATKAVRFSAGKQLKEAVVKRKKKAPFSAREVFLNSSFAHKTGKLTTRP